MAIPNRNHKFKKVTVLIEFSHTFLKHLKYLQCRKSDSLIFKYLFFLPLDSAARGGPITCPNPSYALWVCTEVIQTGIMMWKLEIQNKDSIVEPSHCKLGTPQSVGFLY